MKSNTYQLKYINDFTYDFIRIIKTGHHPDCHTTTEGTNTSQNYKINSILRGNSIEVRKTITKH